MSDMTPSGRQSTVTKAALAIASACVVLVGVFVIDDWRDDRAFDDRQEQLERAIDDIVATRTESRVAACENNLRFAEAHNKLVMGIATSAGTREIPPSLQAAVDEQLVPIPDCSPPGIIDFYEGSRP